MEKEMEKEIFSEQSLEDTMTRARAAFDALRQAAANAGIQDMSLEEINEEVRLAREGK